MLLIGIMNIAVMALLTVLIYAEKSLPIGRQIVGAGGAIARRAANDASTDLDGETANVEVYQSLFVPWAVSGSYCDAICQCRWYGVREGRRSS
jgi:hypothetical protein